MTGGIKVNYESIQEREIDIVHMLIRFLANWRGLLVFVIIGAILGTFFSLTKMPVKEVYSDTGEVASAVDCLELTESELNQIELAANYYSVYRDLNDYLDKSVMMSMVGKNVVEGRVYYAITGSSGVNEVIAHLQGYTDDNSYYEELKELAQIDLGIEYLKETSSYTTPYATETTVTYSESSQATIVCYSITYDDEEGAQRIIESANELIMAEVKALSGKYSGVKVECLGTYTSDLLKTTAIDKRNSYYNQMNTALANYNKIAAEFKGTKAQILANYIAGDESAIATSKRAVHKTTVFSINVLIKYMLIGALGLALVAALHSFIGYMFSKRIRTSQEVENLIDTRVVAVKHNDASNKFDRFFENALDRRAGNNSSLEYAAECVRISSSEGKVLLMEDNVDEKMFDGLFDQEKDSVTSLKGALVSDSEILKKVIEVNKVWLVVRADKSDIISLHDELKILNHYSVVLMGIIVV